MYRSRSCLLRCGITILGMMVVLLPCAAQVRAEQTESTDIPPDMSSKDMNTDKEAGQGIPVDHIQLFFHMEDTTRALDMEENGISGLNDIAGESVQANQLARLKATYQRILEQDPDDVTTWTRLGRVLETMGEEDAAYAAFQKAVALDPANQVARQGIRRYETAHRVQARLYTTFLYQQEYAPFLERDIATWEEQTISVQVSKSWGQGKTLGLGWLEGSIYQRNELYEDVDFSLTRQAPFVSFSWPVLQNTMLTTRIRDEKFTNDDASGFYKVDGSEHIITGYCTLLYRGSGFWTHLHYSRERETDPVYDPENERSALNIAVKQLTGAAAGYALAPAWELGGSIYYEQYGSRRDDQFNANIQLSHWFASLPGARISLGYGYYTEEQENLVNLDAVYQWQARDSLQVRFEYTLEYSENEDSWLNEGDMLLTWSVTDRLAMVVRADCSQESGGDEDRIFSVQASINWSFY